MHRVLVITIGRKLEPMLARLKSDYEQRVAAGFLSADRVQIEFLAAPVEGVGNLSNPVEALRETLYRNVIERLETLLELRPGRRGPFFVDIVFITNHGEALASRSEAVVFNAVHDVIPSRFGALFPDGRAASERRLKLISLALTPLDRSTNRERSEVLDALEEHYMRLSSLRSQETHTSSNVLFILDGLTEHGLAREVDIVAQAENFVRLLAFSGARRHELLVRLLETESDDIGATFGIASCSIRPEGIVSSLRRRLTRSIADALRGTPHANLPSLNELIPASCTDSDSNFREVLEGVQETPIRVLEIDGPGALPFTTELFENALQRLEHLGRESNRRPHESTELDEDTDSRGWLITLGAISVGSLTALIGVVALGLAILPAVASGGALTMVAMIAFYILSQAASTQAPTPDDSRKHKLELEAKRDRAAALEAALLEQLRRVNALMEHFENLTRDLDTHSNTAGPTADDPPSSFVSVLESDELYVELFESVCPYLNGPAALQAWVEALGGWRRLFEEPYALSNTSLVGFSLQTLDETVALEVFENTNCRNALQPVIRNFLETWGEGPPRFLEHISQQQHDADGFKHPVKRAIFMPESLEPAARETLGETSRISPAYSDSNIHDVFVVDTTTDIGLNAIPILTQRRA